CLLCYCCCLHDYTFFNCTNTTLLYTLSLHDALTILFYGVIDPATMILQYSVGGHFPMPVLLQQGQARYLEGRGMPVGLFREAKYETHEYQLQQDFPLLLFSDGILEIIPQPSLQEKEVSLLDMVRISAGDLGHLAALLQLDALPEVPDDIAMMAIGRSKVSHQVKCRLLFVRACMLFG